MALIDRITRLFQADMHAVLDRIEDPEQALRLAMRDMDDELRALDEKRRLTDEAARVVSRRIGELDAEIGDVDAEIDIAFDHQREDLARAVIRRKLALQVDRKALEAEAQRLADRREEVEQTQKDHQATLDDLHRQIAQCRDHRAAQRDELRPEGRATQGIDDHDVEIAFLREQQARVSS